MKVLLEQDVKSLGKKGEIVNVSDGYARNFLLPRRLASPADAAAVNAANISKSAAAHRKYTAGVEAREKAKQLEGASVTLAANVGENGRMFGAIGAKEIAAAMVEQLHVDIDKKKVALADPIKAVGEYTVKISLFEGTVANIRVIVKEG